MYTTKACRRYSRKVINRTQARLALFYLLMISASVSAQSGSVAMPSPLPAGEFKEVLVQVGDNLYIAGQPTEAGLQQLHEAGVTTVINLRTHHEMNDRSIVDFDEAAVLAELGVRYFHIPSGGQDTPYNGAMVEEFARAMNSADGKVLLHCTVAWRASHLYTAYLHRYAGLSLQQAVEHGRAINLGRLPLEGFLGEPILFGTADE